MSTVRWAPDVFRWSAPEAERAGRPLLVMLHGLGADENDLIALVPHLPSELVAVSVRAPLLYGDRFAWFDRPRPADQALDDSREGQRSLVTWLRSLSGHSTLGVLGFSQGAAVAVGLLRSEPDLLDHVVQLAGFLAPTTPDDDTADIAANLVHPTRRVPVFSGHGDQDTVIPPAEVRSLALWLRSNADLTERRYPDAAHEISTEMLADVVEFLRGQWRS